MGPKLAENIVIRKEKKAHLKTEGNYGCSSFRHRKPLNKDAAFYR
jgi:hypothetical protein